MSIRNKYEEELKRVFGKLVAMCRATEQAIDRSVTALRDRNAALSREVMEEDRNIDNMERDIEQDCLKILLMEHPVAGDFRDVSAALKMITDLERIADQAADISEISLQFGEDEFIRHMIHMRNSGYNNYVPQRVNFPKLNSQIIKQMATSEGFQDDLYAQQQLQNAIREQQIYPVNWK